MPISRRRTRWRMRGGAGPVVLACVSGLVALGIVMTGSRGSTGAGGDASSLDPSIASACDTVRDGARNRSAPMPVDPASRAWRLGLSADAGGPIPVGDLLAIVDGGELRLLDPESGVTVRRVPAPRGPVGDVRLAGGNLVWAEDDGIVCAMDPTSGDLRWQHDLEQRPTSSATDRDRLWFASGTDVVCLAASTGTLAWRRPMSERPLSGVDVASGAGVAAAGDELVAWNPANGRVRWRVSIDAGIWGNPVIAGTMVVVADSSGSVSAYRLARGKRRWMRDLGGVPAGSPVVHSGGVFMGTVDGVVEQLDLASGERRWRSRTATGHVVGAIDATLFCVDGVRTLTSVRIEDGNITSRNSLSGSLREAPVLFRGYMIVRTDAGLEAKRHPVRSEEDPDEGVERTS